MKNYKIYTLNDPITNEIRYVGQTCNSLNSRLTQHLKSKGGSYRVKWINSLIKKGLKPTINLLVEGLDKNECNSQERFYIKTFREQGIKLVNMTDGGEGSFGFKHTDKTKKLLCEIRKKNNTQENKDLIARLAKERWSNASEETILNNILNQKGRRDILQYTNDGVLVKEFISLRQIERELGFFRANIIPCLKGQYKQAYGYIWRYKN